MNDTVWVLGDQLNRAIGALADTSPTTTRVLLVESRAMIEGRRYHRARLHLVITAMRRFAGELEDAGYEVDYRRATSLRAGLEAHRKRFAPQTLRATEPNGRTVDRLLRELGVELVASNQFLCHRNEFARWADDADSLRLENFYRFQRQRLGYLMDGDEPAGGRWNHDHDNREPPPADGDRWPGPVTSELDEVDREVLDSLPKNAIGERPSGLWATSRRAALARLRHFVDVLLPGFGPHEDAMLSGNWHLAHSLLSPYLNLGLLLPGEVCDAVEHAYRNGDVAINSAEGMIRQLIGWREFVWGIYWLWPDQTASNRLNHRRKLPPSWVGEATTEARCLQTTLDDLDARGYVHHIQRLMILANFANLYGIRPGAVREWMRERYVDGADWVMGPNVHGMALWSDGGRMATKPYVSGGAYIKRMSDYCSGCRFDPAKRSGANACPFTSLYWDFLARHRPRLNGNFRLARQYATLDKLKDLDATRARARSVIRGFRDGEL
ncbi:MAG: cryptochrome/photolyase family protein [Pseudomonadales bacterium]